MNEQSSQRGQVVKQILQKEDLPPDLLDRAVDLPEPENEHLFSWVMRLRDVLSREEEEVVGDVLNDGVLVSGAGSELISREVDTLTDELKASLKGFMEEESGYLEQATFVLAMDVQNQVHNKVNRWQ